MKSLSVDGRVDTELLSLVDVEGTQQVVHHVERGIATTEDHVDQFRYVYLCITRLYWSKVRRA